MSKVEKSNGGKMRWLEVVNALSDLATEAGVAKSPKSNGDQCEIEAFCQRLKAFRGTIEGQSRRPN